MKARTGKFVAPHKFEAVMLYSTVHAGNNPIQQALSSTPTAFTPYSTHEDQQTLTPYHSYAQFMYGRSQLHSQAPKLSIYSTRRPPIHNHQSPPIKNTHITTIMVNRGLTDP